MTNIIPAGDVLQRKQTRDQSNQKQRSRNVAFKGFMEAPLFF